MLMIVILLLFSFVQVAQPTQIAQAQDAETMWYFAQKNGDLIAFTPEGEQQTVMPNFGEVQGGWRWDSKTVLYLTEDDNNSSHLYRVTSQEATEIPLTLPDDIDSTNLKVMLIAYAGDYLVFREATPTQIPSPGILVNVPEATAEILTGAITREARFLDDATLRYISVVDGEDGDQQVWSLLERSLPNDDETAIYSFSAEENTTPFFTVDSSGDQWVSVARNADRQLISLLVNANGATEPLESGTSDDPIYWRFVGDTLFSTQPRCETDCPITVRDSDDEMVFMLPTSDAGFGVLARPSDDTLLVMGAEREIMLLTENEEPKSLGEFDPVVMLTNRIDSPDERYLFTVSPSDETDNARQIFVTDLQNLSQIFTADFSTAGLVTWREEGFFATFFNEAAQAFVYFYDDDTLVELPYPRAGIYSEILPDNSLLYMLHERDTEIGSSGIYRYDLSTETFTPVVEGARFLYAEPLRDA